MLEQRTVWMNAEKGMNPKVLVVEDEPSLVDTLEYSLTRQGYHVIVAMDGVKALEAARQGTARFDRFRCDVTGIGWIRGMPNPAPGDECSYPHVDGPYRRG